MAAATFKLFSELGVLNNLKSVSTCRHEGKWEIWGHFQSNEGRKNARIAQFDTVEDAVDFEVLCEGLTR